jgi:hypothetical protein
MAGRKEKLFVSIVAEETQDGTFILKGEKGCLSPHEYQYFWQLTPQAYALKRHGYKLVDIVFRNGRVFFAADYAYPVGSLGPDNGEYHLIAAILTYGTLIMDDRMDIRLFVPGYPRVELVDSSLIVVYLDDRPGPRVRVYDLHGKLLTEGDLWGAIYAAREEI